MTAITTLPSGVTVYNIDEMDAYEVIEYLWEGGLFTARETVIELKKHASGAELDELLQLAGLTLEDETKWEA